MTDRILFQPSPEMLIPASIQRVVAYQRSTTAASLKRTSLRKGLLAEAHMVTIFTMLGEYRVFVFMAYVERPGGVLMSSPGARATPEKIGEREQQVVEWLEEVDFEMKPVPLDEATLQTLAQLLPLSRLQDLNAEPGELPDERAARRDPLQDSLGGLSSEEALERLRSLMTFWGEAQGQRVSRRP